MENTKTTLPAKGEEFYPEPGEVTFGSDVMDQLDDGKMIRKSSIGYHTAIKVQKARDMDSIVKKVLKEAKYAKEEFYYNWEVTGKNNKKRMIEGPSIGLAMCVAREWGNCVTLCEIDKENADHWVLNGIFIDLETGFTIKRQFRQTRKKFMGTKMEKDPERKEDILFQIGQSKAMRNATTNAIPRWLLSQAIQTAKKSVLEDIKNTPNAKDVAISSFKEIGIEEDQLKFYLDKPIEKWTDDDIAQLRGIYAAILRREAKISDYFAPTRKSSKNSDDNKDKPKKGRKTDAEKRTELHRMISEMSQDEAEYKDLVKIYSHFIGNDEKEVFVEDINKLKGKWLNSTYGKAKKHYEDLQKSKAKAAKQEKSEKS